MEQSKILGISFSGTSITKNTIYNLLGYGIPMVLAIVVLPFLIDGLGTERYGVLSLSWMVIGYFSFFDFGIGKSLTKIIAEKIGKDDSNQIPDFFWLSFFFMLAISLLLVFILLFFVPSIVNLFNISKELYPETLKTFYLLVLSIPLVTTTAGLRGTLEAYQKFGTINIIRTFLGVFTFLGPLICLIFTNSLFWIILFLVVIRIVVWLLYLRLCFKVDYSIGENIRLNFKLVKPLFKFSAWITVANVVGPLIINVDRYLIGILISLTAVAYYSTPYDVITKLLLIPNALVIVLFPVFSASYVKNLDISLKLFNNGVKYIFITLYPVVFLIIAFSYHGLLIWLGPEFAKESSLILKLLAIGILFNSIAYIPFNFFQGVGRPNIPAIMNLIELPIYIFIMWVSIEKWGINGAACVWLLRIIIDTAIIFFIAYWKFDIRYESKKSIFSILIASLCLVVPIFFSNIYFNIIYSIVCLSIFIYITWKYFISFEEKTFFLSKLNWNAFKFHL